MVNFNIYILLRVKSPLSWNSPGKNIGMGSRFLLQEIFLTEGSNPGLLHCSQILYHLSCQGSPPAATPNKDIYIYTNHCICGVVLKRLQRREIRGCMDINKKELI